MRRHVTDVSITRSEPGMRVTSARMHVVNVAGIERDDAHVRNEHSPGDTTTQSKHKHDFQRTNDLYYANYL